MSRNDRIDYEGAWHHVMNRGRTRQAIVRNDDDRRRFVRLVALLPARFGLEVHAYCLMDNHYHALVRSCDARLSQAMAYLDGVYTQTFNRLHGTDGALFRGRFTSRLIEDEAYLVHVAAYIHANPVEAGLVTSCVDFAWSSHPSYALIRPTPSWLSVDVITGYFSSPEAFTGWADRLPVSTAQGTPQPNRAAEPVRPSDSPKEQPRPRTSGHSVTGSNAGHVDTLIDVAALLGTEPAELTSGGPGKRNVERMIAAMVLRERYGRSNRQIAEILAYKSTQAASQAIQRLHIAMENDAGLTGRVNSALEAHRH